MIESMMFLLAVLFYSLFLAQLFSIESKTITTGHGATWLEFANQDFTLDQEEDLIKIGSGGNLNCAITESVGDRGHGNVMKTVQVLETRGWDGIRKKIKSLDPRGVPLNPKKWTTRDCWKRFVPKRWASGSSLTRQISAVESPPRPVPPSPPKPIPSASGDEPAVNSLQSQSAPDPSASNQLDAKKKGASPGSSPPRQSNDKPNPTAAGFVGSRTVSSSDFRDLAVRDDGAGKHLDKWKKGLPSSPLKSKPKSPPKSVIAEFGEDRVARLPQSQSAPDPFASNRLDAKKKGASPGSSPPRQSNDKPKPTAADFVRRGTVRSSDLKDLAVTDDAAWDLLNKLKRGGLIK